MAVDLSSISAPRLMKHVDEIAAMGPGEDGTTANHLAADYVVHNLEALGLQVQRQSVPCWVIEPVQTSLTVVKPKQMDIKCYHGNLTGVTSREGVTGELVFVDKAFDEHFEGRHVSGKIALAW